MAERRDSVLCVTELAPLLSWRRCEEETAGREHHRSDQDGCGVWLLAGLVGDGWKSPENRSNGHRMDPGLDKTVNDSGLEALLGLGLGSLWGRIGSVAFFFLNWEGDELGRPHRLAYQRPERVLSTLAEKLLCESEESIQPAPAEPEELLCSWPCSDCYSKTFELGSGFCLCRDQSDPQLSCLLYMSESRKSFNLGLGGSELTSCLNNEESVGLPGLVRAVCQTLDDHSQSSPGPKGSGNPFLSFSLVSSKVGPVCGRAAVLSPRPASAQLTTDL